MKRLLIGLLLLPSVALASGDYSEEQLGLRLAPAFIRFLEVSAIGGQTVANRASSAINPAAADWFEMPGKNGTILVPYYTHTEFDSGAEIDLYALSATWRSENLGTFQPTAAALRSNRAMTNQGTIFDYEVDSYQLQWAKRSGDHAIGVTLNFADAGVAIDAGGLRVADTNSESYRFRGGWLLEVGENVMVGLIVEYGFAPFRTNAIAITPGGPVPVMIKDTQYQYIARPGVSWQYGDMSSVYVDYQYGAFSNDSGTLESHRFSAGIEHRVVQWLFLRLNVASDVRGNTGFGVGASIMFARWGSVHIGYEYDPFPEIRFEFGRAQYFQVIVAFYF